MFCTYKFSVILLLIESFLLFSNLCCGTLDSDEGQNSSQKYRVDGTVSIPFTVDQSWTANTRVIVDGGQRLAFLRLAVVVCSIRVALQIQDRSQKSRPVSSLNQSQTQMTRPVATGLALQRAPDNYLPDKDDFSTVSRIQTE